MRSFWEKPIEQVLVDLSFWGSIILGVFLRIRQYAINRSLWVDEASLALNIVHRSFGALLQPLDYNQGAPIGFLFVEKILISIFGNNEWTLRFFPLLSGILSVYLIYLISRKYFGKLGLIAVASFSFSSVMIYYSSELKQYSTDVTVALLIIYLTLRCLDEVSNSEHVVQLGIAGIAGVFLSHPSVFVLSVAEFLLFINSLLKKDFIRLRWVFAIVLMWVGAFLLTYLVSLRYLIGNTNLQDYWSNGYAPIPPWKNFIWYKNVLASILPQVNSPIPLFVFPGFRQEYLTVFCLLLVFIGLIGLFVRDFQLATLVAAPFMVAFVASALHRYPMSDRFLYFLFPLVLLLMAEGIGFVYFVIEKIDNKSAIIVSFLLSFLILWSPLITMYDNALRPPLGEDIKPILNYIQSNAANGDEIYVHAGSTTPFLYYLPFYNFKTDDIFVAQKSLNTKRFIVDVDAYQGTERVWFVFSHVVTCDCEATDRAGRIQAYVDILNQYGVQLDHFNASNAVTYLYDLDP